MATHDYVIDNGTGSAVRADLNNLFKALLTNNSGTTDPSTVISSDAGSKAFSFWADTNSSPAVLKIRNAADDGWIELFQLDGTLTLEDGSASTPALAFRDDLDTGIYSSAANTFNIATGGTERMELGTTTIFNEDGADVDFRIESDTSTHAFFVDAGNSVIGMGSDSPSSFSSAANTLVLNTSSANCGLTISTSAADQIGSIFFAEGTGSTGDGRIRYEHANNAMAFSTDNAEALRINDAGKVMIGNTDTGYASFADDLTIGTNVSGHHGITIRSANNKQGNIYFSDGASGIGDETFRGMITYNHSTDAMSFGTSSSSTIFIDSSGNFLIGTSATLNSGKAILNFTGGGRGLGIQAPSDADGSQVLHFYAGTTQVGNVNVTTSQTNFDTGSDYRLKENAVAISDGITRLKTLKPYRFNFKVEPDKTVDGFFAHEVTAVPEAVRGTKDEVDSDNNPVYQTMDYSKITTLITAALQEAIAKIEVLETKVAALEAG